MSTTAHNQDRPITERPTEANRRSNGTAGEIAPSRRAEDAVDPHAAKRAELARRKSKEQHKQPERRRQISDEDRAIEAQILYYDRIVRVTLRASVLLLLAQVVSSLVLSNFFQARLIIQYFPRSTGFRVPYLAIMANTETYLKVVTWSTVVAVAATCAAAMWALRSRKSDPATVYGWSTGIVMSGLLLGFQWLRGWLQPPGMSNWILLQAAAVVGACAVLFIGFRPDEDLVPTETSANPGSPHLLADTSTRVTTTQEKS